MLRDIRKGDDPQLAAITAVIQRIAPDILLLTDFDYDLDGLALEAFNASGPGYPHLFALRPNTGLQTGIDLDGNGRTGDARDGQGYGRFAGDGGMAILSRFPIETDLVQDLSATLWKDVDGATLPMVDGKPFPSVEAQSVQKLSTTGHWIVPLALKGGLLTLMAWSATPPVFDGAEDRNGLRNRDELLMWENVLAQGAANPFIVLGNANLDPADGQGKREAMKMFLSSPLIQNVRPESEGGRLSANAAHQGDPALDTASWDREIPGNLRVSYVLPSHEIGVSGAGVFWPAPEDSDRSILGVDGSAAGPHRLVWVDLEW